VANPLPPEARTLQGERAGLVSRLLAGGIDYAIAVAVTGVAWLGTAVVRLTVRPARFSWPEWSGATWLAVYLGVLVLSLAIPWAATGRSVGKRVLGLRLLNHDGHRVRALVALGRALLCVAFPIGLFWVPASDDERSVHDLLFRTRVVYDWTRHVPPPAHASA
jgi:uncharacterized RDD family membrane protein YckC